MDRDEVYDAVSVNKLRQRAKAHLLKLMYKRAQNDIFLNQEEARIRLHDAPVLLVPFPNNETYKKSIIFMGSNAWNSPSPDERNIPTSEGFKSMLRRKLSENSLC